MKLLLILPIIILSACSTNVESNHETGSHKITCRNATTPCYDKAIELCPDGYLVTNRMRPYKEGRDKVFHLNVRCRGKITR